MAGLTRNQWVGVWSGGATIVAALITTVGMLLAGSGGVESAGEDRSAEVSTPSPTADPPRPSADLEQSEPTAVMEPDSGRAESKATFKGVGFRPGEQVRITWSPWLGTDTAVLRDATAGSDGTFAAEVNIPKFGILSSYEDGASVLVRAVGLASERSAETYFLLEPK